MYSSENQFLRKVFLDFKGPLSILVCQSLLVSTNEVLAKELWSRADRFWSRARRNGENCILAAKNLRGAKAVPPATQWASESTITVMVT